MDATDCPTHKHNTPLRYEGESRLVDTDSELMDQRKNRESEKGRGRGGGGNGESQKPRQSKQLNRAALCPKSLTHIPFHIQLVIVSCLLASRSQKGKYAEGSSRNVCETHLACLDWGPGALMTSGIHLDDRREDFEKKQEWWTERGNVCSRRGKVICVRKKQAV